MEIYISKLSRKEIEAKLETIGTGGGSSENSYILIDYGNNGDYNISGIFIFYLFYSKIVDYDYNIFNSFTVNCHFIEFDKNFITINQSFFENKEIDLSLSMIVDENTSFDKLIFDTLKFEKVKIFNFANAINVNKYDNFEIDAEFYYSEIKYLNMKFSFVLKFDKDRNLEKAFLIPLNHYCKFYQDSDYPENSLPFEKIFDNFESLDVDYQNIYYSIIYDKRITEHRVVFQSTNGSEIIIVDNYYGVYDINNNRYELWSYSEQYKELNVVAIKYVDKKITGIENIL